jgi:predicted nucleic acid-binding protein
MKPVFLDASGLIAVANKADQWHDRAMAVWRDLTAQKATLSSSKFGFGQ